MHQYKAGRAWYAKHGDCYSRVSFGLVQIIEKYSFSRQLFIRIREKTPQHNIFARPASFGCISTWYRNKWLYSVCFPLAVPLNLNLNPIPIFYFYRLWVPIQYMRSPVLAPQKGSQSRLPFPPSGTSSFRFKSSVDATCIWLAACWCRLRSLWLCTRLVPWSSDPMLGVYYLLVLLIHVMTGRATARHAHCYVHVNGCSIPGDLPFFYKKKFTPACNKHDVCYGCVSPCHACFQKYITRSVHLGNTSMTHQMYEWAIF